MNTAIIGLGSNIDPQLNIKAAEEILANHFKVLEKSKFVTTQAIGDIPQPDFINGAMLVTTDQNFESLKQILKDIEIKLGRQKQHKKFDPRTIDLDILIWNDKVVDKDFYTRDFVKKSVLQLLPHLEY